MNLSTDESFLFDFPFHLQPNFASDKKALNNFNCMTTWARLAHEIRIRYFPTLFLSEYLLQEVGDEE